MASTTLKILHEYQEFIKKRLQDDDYKLVKAPPIDKQGVLKPEFVIPPVITGCLPHANFSLYGAENIFFQAPYIMVGFDDSVIGDDETSIQLLIQACCYSSASYVTDENNELYDLDIPDNKSFEDCVNLLEWIKQKILDAGIIAGTTIEKPVRLGTYNSKELTYPYSFGYISFQVNSVRHEINRNKLYN
ncbi:MAG: hypothetical protein K0R46_3529 [Herbinix sp.]|nr:hypothetical protein [Herbinix sp.]